MPGLWSLPGALVAVLIIVGPLGAYIRVLSPGVGFGLFFAGGALAVVSAIALGGTAVIGTLRDSAWRPKALRAAAIPAGVTLLLLVLQIGGGGPSQAFNDVTTNLADPPIFATGPAAGDPYPELFVDWHREAYPELASVAIDQPATESYARALEVARGMPTWEVVREDPASGAIEAVATTSIFRFEDDIAIRVRPDGDASTLDIRSKSRLGRGDLGANAARIHSYLAALNATP